MPYQLDTCSRNIVPNKRVVNKINTNTYSKVPKYIINYKKFLEEAEGGLSSEASDRGNSNVKYHTNKGVRYTTFKIIHKTASYRDFLNMNDSMYIEVIKYHEKVVKSLIREDLDTKTKLFLIEELWACGNLDNYIKLDYNTVTLDTLISIKERRYTNIIKKKPRLIKYKKGWKIRLDKFIKFLASLD